MATESPKQPSTPEESQIPPGPHQFPSPFPPHIFFQPAPGAGDGPPDPNAPQYMFYPQGIMYLPPNAPFPFPSPPPPATTETRQKRKQVKTACTNCATACKRCDDSRPCGRCEKYGIADTCVDGQRKERKKGVKRGPYKRKNKTASASPPFPGAPVEWPNPPIDPNQPPPPLQPIPFPPGTDGPVQYYYPNGPFFALPIPDPNGNPPNGSADPQQPPTMMPLMLHPSAFTCPPHPFASTGYPPPLMGMPMPAPPPPPSGSPSLSPALSIESEKVESVEPSEPLTTAPSETTTSHSDSPFALSSTSSPPSPLPDLDAPTHEPDIHAVEDDEDEDDMEPVILSKSL